MIFSYYVIIVVVILIIKLNGLHKTCGGFQSIFLFVRDKGSHQERNLLNPPDRTALCSLTRVKAPSYFSALISNSKIQNNKKHYQTLPRQNYSLAATCPNGAGISLPLLTLPPKKDFLLKQARRHCAST